MKKNRMLRLASALLVLTLLSTSIVGGTFAKYTTSGTGSDTARVAKWGVTVTTTGKKAFAETYETTDTTAKDKGIVSSVATSVIGEELVAPGTSGNLLIASISGKPEVAVKVQTSASLTLTGWEIPIEGGATEVYCPIVITIDGMEYKMGASADAANRIFNTIESFQTAVEEALNKETKEFAPNTNLGDTTNGYNREVSWKWNFVDDGNNYQTDVKDTALGNLTTAPQIELSYTVTVTQVD